MVSVVDTIIALLLLGIVSGLLFWVKRYLQSRNEKIMNGEPDHEFRILEFVENQGLDWPLILVMGLATTLIYYEQTKTIESSAEFFQRGLSYLFLSLVFLQIGRWIFRIIDYSGYRFFTDPKKNLTNFGQNFIYVSKFITFVILLGYFLPFIGIEIIPFLFPIFYFISICVAILIIGLGISSRIFFENRIAGYILLSKKEMTEGSEIIFEGTSGVIDEIGSQFTKIIVENKNTLMVPNKEFLDQRVLIIN